eukprot:GFUD01019817.1.p1 GENE.GFUD01019817.1~~GFUD01019817.1.p1  ORF type:complete len:111 (+),score=36.30 GFUD01019817.1:54-386(+)
MGVILSCCSPSSKSAHVEQIKDQTEYHVSEELITTNEETGLFKSGAEDPGMKQMEERRKLQADAAERRQQTNEGRGLKDPDGAKRRMEQKAAAARELENGWTGGMRWQVG